MKGQAILENEKGREGRQKTMKEEVEDTDSDALLFISIFA